MDSTKIKPLLQEIKDALIGIPQFDGDSQIDENDEGWFRVCIGYTEKTRPMTDKEIRKNYPVIWARRRLEKLISEMP